MPSLVYVPDFVLPSYRTTGETQASPARERNRSERITFGLR